MLSERAQTLLRKLSDIALSGPIEAVGHGAPAVGMTLLKALGVEYDSTDKPNFHGIVVNAQRRKIITNENRVNLFARVPSWPISAYKSSAAILDEFGYETSNAEKKLYCTVRARTPNPQGLYLEVENSNRLLKENFFRNGARGDVAAWQLEDLENRLQDKHRETMWVRAVAIEKGSIEHFHYREVVYTSNPTPNQLKDLLIEGTVTMDHLIQRKDGKVTEKGPLFKIKPANIELLFPAPQKFDLMSLG